MNNISPIPALDISHLTVFYCDILILSDITVAIPKGYMVGIIGPNGAGKTTLLKAILGLIPVKTGEIAIAGAVGVAACKKIAYVPQRSSVDWDFPLTVFDMVLMGCYGRLGWFKRPTKDDYQKTTEALCLVGLEALSSVPIGTLSGGQQQRAFIARALLQDAQVYFLDEPFAGVDAFSEKIIIKLFAQLCAQGKTVIVVHHDLCTAPSYFNWILLLNQKIIAQGPVETVLNRDNVNKAYGQYSGVSW